MSVSGQNAKNSHRAYVVRLSPDSDRLGDIPATKPDCRTADRPSASSEWHEIVLADSLQHEKYRGRVACIGDEVRALRGDRKSLTPRQTHLFLRLLEKDSDCSLQDIERVVDIVVIMPRHFLRRAYLELGDAKARTRGVIGSTLDHV